MILLRRKYLFYFLSISAGILRAVVVATDIFISVSLITDPLVFGTSLFITGSLLHLFLLLIFNIKRQNRKIGSSIDPLFIGIVIPQGKLLKYLFLAGLGNAIASISYFLIIVEIPDPSAVIPFTNLTTGYLLVGDLLIEKEKPAIIEIQSIFMVILGALLVNISKGSIDLLGLILVLGPLNLGSFGYIFFQKKARSLRRDSNYYDSINLRVWSLIITSLLFCFSIPIITFSFEPLILGIIFSVKYWIPLAIDMLIIFFAHVFYIRALGLGKMSVVNALSSISVVASIPITLILSIIWPSIYVFQVDSITLFIKLIGVVLMFIGIISLSLSEVTAYVFIRTGKRSCEEIVKDLLKIDGIELISFTAGRYDLILRVRLRTLGKAYEKVISKISRINGIEDFVWLSTLKEWKFI